MSNAPLRAPALLAAAGLAVTALALALAGCGAKEAGPVRAQVGDARRGGIWITREGCGACHVIPGLMQANALVGPPLIHFSRRTIIAGYLPNTAENLQRWIQHPQQLAPGNAMPANHLDDQQARDIVAYLYSIK